MYDADTFSRTGCSREQESNFEKSISGLPEIGDYRWLHQGLLVEA